MKRPKAQRSCNRTSPDAGFQAIVRDGREPVTSDAFGVWTTTKRKDGPKEDKKEEETEVGSRRARPEEKETGTPTTERKEPAEGTETPRERGEPRGSPAPVGEKPGGCQSASHVPGGAWPPQVRSYRSWGFARGWLLGKRGAKGKEGRSCREGEAI
ncbi:hypothetical protein NDU88_003493 [Pleurodeles waltl]|uniref:Uncharacterized protein n=1 Tax=Pleurodeles waltl TaxID=8319 RepID=A0AAV7VG96_PLEWA|nr:hypothetical protein NDU88_003493 [Pleurodeles waltl]